MRGRERGDDHRNYLGQPHGQSPSPDVIYHERDGVSTMVA